jgi:hypothetical protein
LVCCAFLFLFFSLFLAWSSPITFLSFPPELFGSLAQNRLSLRSSSANVIMDHAQGRAFHHHLARAIMHLNYLTGLLPFFEPSIEWDDPTPDHQFRTGRPTHASRNLHTFVPLPASSNPPTMVSHGGIPSHMVLNPEPIFVLLRLPAILEKKQDTCHNPKSGTKWRTYLNLASHQALQLHWFSHQIPPFAFSNLLKLHELQVIHRTVPGRTWTIKS